MAITASIISGISGTVWAQPLAITQMVSPTTNQSTASLPYNSINVNQNSPASSVITEAGNTVYVGIGNDGSGTQPMSVYLTTPAAGNYYTVRVSNDGSQDTGYVMAAGAGSLDEAAVTNIHGTLSAQVTATGAGNGKGVAEAIGIGAIAGTLTTETVTMSVTAAGGVVTDESEEAKAKAHGIVNGNDGVLTQPLTTIGVTGGANSIAAKATGGTAQGILNDVSATVYGAENYGSLTLRGETTLSADAKGGAVASGGTSSAGDAYGEAYGLYNSGSAATLITDNLIIDYVKATGTTGTNALGFASGISNVSGGTVTTAALALNNISAKGGSADSGGSADATAFGVQNQEGSVTTGTFDITVRAAGGISDTSAVGQAYGLAAGENAGDAVNLSMGTTGIANTITVTAIGGNSSGLDENTDVSATAYGIFASNTTDLHGKITFSVQATGGQRFEAGNLAGNVIGTAYGIHNQGTSFTADDVNFITVSAQGGTGADAEAYAYGINNVGNSSGPVAAEMTVGVVNFTNVSATGGNAGTNGNATALATLLYNENNNIFTTTGKLTGNVTATGGFGPSANAAAYGISNNGTLNGTNFEITATAAGQTAADETTAEARGIMNFGTLTMSGGANKITATAQGGTSSDGALVYAFACGIDNYQSLTLTGPTTFSVQATGGAPAAGAAEAVASDASAEAYGLRNQTDEATTGPLTFALVKAQGGTGDTAYATAYGIYNENAPHTIYATSINMTEVNAQGGTGDNAYAQAYGIKNNYSTLGTGDGTAVNSLLVRAAGGTATAATSNVSAEAYGLANENSGRASLIGSWIFDVQATGGSAGSGVTPEYSSADAVGIINKSTNGIEINGPVTIAAAAVGGAAGNNSGIHAAGIYSENGTVQLRKSVDISAVVTPVSGAAFIAASLYADTNGVINVGTDGTDSLGQIVKLQGDVGAKNENAVLNITLDQPDSYLQGNVKEMNDGVVNLIVGGGAAWEPVYDNRYGSFYAENDAATFTKDYTVSANSIPRLTLNEGGVVDLTWDKATRNPSTDGRTLTIGRLSGNNGIFKINSDLAQNVADKLSIAGADAATTNAYIQVKYDPYLATADLAAGSTLAGKAEVVSAAPSTLIFTGKQGEYNLYQYTPTVIKDTDGKWYLTNITINNVSDSGNAGGGDTGGGDSGDGTGGGDTGGGGNTGGNTVTTITGPVRSIAQTHLGLHELFLGEVNNLEKRLGDLRQTNPAEAGVWARYHHGKLDHNESSVKYNLFQAGFDKESRGSGETTYRGLAVSHAKGSGSYEIGSGDLSETTLSLYQTGVKKNGQYYDVIFKAGRYSNDYDLVSEGDNKSHADYHTWAYSLSSEYGVRKQLGHGFYVEPQAELILGRIQGADYVTSTNMNAHVDAQNKAIARLGVAAGKEFKGGTLYGKANYYHDFSGGIHIKAADGANSVLYSNTVAHNWCELSLGGTAKAGKNMVVYGELSKYLGQLKSNLQVNVGARWTF
jgi:outer membrane autotransporter protein